MFILSLRRVYALLFLLSIQCALFGMEVELTSKNMILCAENNKQTLWDVIIAHGVLCDDYDMHRQLALVSTAHNKLVEDSYRPKKKIIEDFLLKDWLCPKEITGSRSWNKDFSQCAWVDIYDMAKGYPHLPEGEDVRLTFTFVSCANDGPVKWNSCGWDKCYFPIFEDNVRPFFNKEGQAYFYGYGEVVLGERDAIYEPHWMDDMLCSHSQRIQDRKKGIIEYCIDIDGKRKSFDCMCHASSVAGQQTAHSDDRSFIDIMNFPLLLKALLQSKNVETTLALYDRHSSQKNFKIEGVTLPESYKTYKKHVDFCKLSSKKTQCMSYEDLSSFLRNAFDNKYAEQQEKNEHK